MLTFYNIPFYISFSIYTTWITQNFSNLNLSNDSIFTSWLFVNFLYYCLWFLIFKIVKYFVTILGKVWF